MKSAGFWLCAASVLALTACQKPKPAAAGRPAATAVASAAPGAAAAKPGAAAVKPATAAPAAVQVRTTSEAAASAGHVRPKPGRRHGEGLGRAPAETEVAVTATPDEANWSSQPREKTYSAEYKACTSSANGFTAARANCFNAELSRQGARLDRAYTAAMAGRSDAQKRRLSQAQHAWTELRDSKCQGDKAGGADVLHEGSCRLQMTIQRATELERMTS